MTILDESTIVVYTHAELSSALTTADNGIDYVYLGADINMTAGIRVDPGKTSLTIDGLYTAISPDIRVLTDTGNSGGQIYMNSITAAGADITFQNLIINGRNYYGMPYIYDVTNAEHVSVTYNNVTYAGPQLIWHPRGLARIIDCDVTIMNNGYSAMNEVAEINRVEIGGTTKIRHNNSNLYAVFYFYKANPHFTVYEDADVEISTMRDFLYNEGSYYVPITIGARARFTLTTARAITRSSAHRAASVLVDEDAVFRYIRESSTGEAHALYINGMFTVRQRATVYMQADFDNSGSMLRFTSSTGGLDIDNPKSFVIYNRGTVSAAAAVSFYTSAISISLRLAGGQVNFWRDAELFPLAGGLDDEPAHKWNRPDWTSFELRGTANSSATSITYNDFTPEELADLPALSNLQLTQARVLSIGNLPLEVEPIIIGQNLITGTTEGGARVRARFLTMGPEEEGDADSAGHFELAPVAPIPYAEIVTVFSNTPFLIVSVMAESREEGELIIKEAPEFIEFDTRTFTDGSVVLLPRRDPSVPVIVEDTRYPDKTEWQLYAAIDGPLTTAEGDILDEGLVFAIQDGSLVTLGETPILVHTDGPYLDDEKSVIWDSDRGLLVRITVPIRSGIPYTAQVHWSVYPSGEGPEGGEDNDGNRQ